MPTSMTTIENEIESLLERCCSNRDNVSETAQSFLTNESTAYFIAQI